MILVCVLVVLMAMTGTHVLGRYLLNYSSAAFNEGLTGGSSLSGAMAQSTSIETCVIQGAGYYFKAYSYSLLMANEIELSDLEGVNFVELRSFINQAIDNMELACDTYIDLVNKANSTSYNSAWINQLMNFDYGAFKAENGLNEAVFSDVQYFLSNGNVRGVYVETETRFETILEDLYDIKAGMDGNSLPANSTIWRLNQKFLESMLFGQYVAEVFYQIVES